MTSVAQLTAERDRFAALVIDLEKQVQSLTKERNRFEAEKIKHHETWVNERTNRLKAENALAAIKQSPSRPIWPSGILQNEAGREKVDPDPGTAINWKGLATYLANSLQTAHAELDHIKEQAEELAGEESRLYEDAVNLGHHFDGTNIGASMDFGVWWTKDGWSTAPIPGLEDEDRPKVTL